MRDKNRNYIMTFTHSISSKFLMASLAAFCSASFLLYPIHSSIIIIIYYNFSKKLSSMRWTFML